MHRKFRMPGGHARRRSSFRPWNESLEPRQLLSTPAEEPTASLHEPPIPLDLPLPELIEPPAETSQWHGDDPLNGAKILIVDDDIRNVFALTSVLERHGSTVVYAENGREGIEQLERNEDVALVLMDIMMPEMDGIATMQEIRKLPRGRELPMVAVTAKAMKGDRQKCIEAGAWDYLSKPVDPLNLLAVLRGWLCR